MPPFSQSSDQRGLALRRDDVVLRLDLLTAGILRVRKHAGAEPPVPPLIRYGLFNDDWADVAFQIEEGDGSVTVRTDLLAVTISADETIAVADAEGRELLREAEPAMPGPAPGFRVRFALPPEARFVGLGDQTRERIEQRGEKGDLWICNVTSYIPIPFVISSEGYGLLFNTTRRLFYDLGATSEDWFGFEAEEASLDYYLICGPTPAAIINRYTQITGRPMLPPHWAMGLWFICRTQADARELVDDCMSFRREGIPCDAIGLEPGWMAQNYDYSINKQWHPERFPIPSYERVKYTFFGAAQRMGFKPGLWLCCDYDLSYEEERRVAPDLKADQGRAEAEQARAAFAEGHEVDEHLIQARRMDGLTDPEQPWFEHLKKFVDEGAHWFKQDGSNQVLDHPDRLWGNGMRDAEMHNLYPLLYSKQMLLGFREHTGRRTFPFTPAGWAGLQRWTGTWTGDTGGEVGPLVACLNLSLSGHGLSTCDMQVTTPEGIHFGMLLPWAQLSSWNYFRHPWYQGERLQGIFTDYARLRYSLLPYLYSCAWEAHTTGMPMLRAMPLAYPEDPESYGCLRQYMLGPSLLVGAFTDKVYLPEGDWYNFWTGERMAGGGWVEPRVPEDRGGPLLVPAGAIIPYGPGVDYVGQRPDDELTVHLYAGAAGRFVLYEDDGTTFAFEEGACRIQEIRQEPTDGGMRVVIEEPQGGFEGAVERRALDLVIHGLEEPPPFPTGDAAALPADAESWWWDDEGRALHLDLGEREMRRIEIVIGE
jgi:alpha-glucosidase